MKLTEAERLIIALLCQPKDDPELDREFIFNAIMSGNSWAIGAHGMGNFSEDVSDEVATFVGDVMSLYRLIEQSHEQLDSDAQKRIEGMHLTPKFRGFDGNSESEHLGAAYGWTKLLDRFEEFQGRDLNSHYPMIEKYEAQLDVYSSMDNSVLRDGFFSEETLVKILKG
jgi:uncharacterized protein YfbU (UPF0304 family)